MTKKMAEQMPKTWAIWNLLPLMQVFFLLLSIRHLFGPAHHRRCVAKIELRVRAKITSHFSILASAHLWPIPHSQNPRNSSLFIGFALSDQPNLNQIYAPILGSYFCANPKA